MEQHRGRTFVFELNEDWLPTPENINALPEPLRQYIHQLETLSDPARLVWQNMALKDQLAALLKKFVSSGLV